ncbi:MAG: GxxExxY protein [Acidobacteria bacterium]|nr:GxxExxY protein [Acidobacteriota bacterium]
MNHGDTETQRRSLPNEVNALTGEIVDAAFKVHSALGPGLLESVYEICMVHELEKRGLEVARQIEIPVEYDGRRLDSGLRLDLLIAGTVIVELKAVEQVLPVHKAQLLSYLRLSDKPVGLLINFYVPLIKDGIQRMVL